MGHPRFGHDESYRRRTRKALPESYSTGSEEADGGGLVGNNNRFLRSDNSEPLLLADLPSEERLEETDEHGAELNFNQLLLDDTPTEPVLSFPQSQETPVVDDQLPVDLQTELPSHLNIVLSPPDRIGSNEIGEASRHNPQQRPVGPLGERLPTSIQQIDAAVGTSADATDIDSPLSESAQEQVASQKTELYSASDLPDTASFDRPSLASNPTPQLELPTLPTGLASHQKVTQNVVETIVEQAQLTEVGESKQLTLQLHPAELGQVTLLVEWETDSLKVKIIANELAANEILNRNKSELIAALAEEGIDFDSLDVSYGNAQSEPQEHDQNFRSQQLAPELFTSPADPENTETTSPISSSNLDITV